MIKSPYFKNLRITTKFILWFLFIALIPLGIATFISYSSSRRVLEQEVAKRLFAVADNKANQIEAYLREKERNVTELSFTSDVYTALEKFNEAFKKGGIGSAEYAAVYQEYSAFLDYYQKSFGYDDLILVSSEGEIIFSATNKEDSKSLYEIALRGGSELASVFVRTVKSLKTEISNFEYSPYTGKARVFISIPVLSGGNFVGAVIAKMSNQGLSELVKGYAGLGNTGETTIATKINNEVVFITPLRFDSEAAFKRKIALGSEKGEDIQKAFQVADVGSGICVDYRGEKVSAIWRYLPSFRLGMTVKMDAKEILVSVNRLRNALLTISIVLLVAVVIMAIFIARSISEPIKELTKVSGIIAGGNLSTRAAINAGDEIGELAYAFNRMTDSLVEAKAVVEQKKDELEEQKKLLEKANQELDSFVYTASHDLRAPLRAISSFSSFLEEDYKDKIDAQGKDHLSEVRKGAERMSRLIDDLLKLSRISRIKNPYEDVNIQELINSVIERIKFDIEQYKVDLSIQKDIPTVRCDRIKMTEAFLNLINNAIKFSSKNNKENPKVEIGYEDRNEFHQFFVKDNGIGIDPKYHKQIFGIFQRLHTEKEYEGTGAGLSIVERIIDGHGGKIWVESEVGKGATFYFTIPKDLKEDKKSEKK